MICGPDFDQLFILCCHLGDYFGVLLDARVTGFPFNMFRDPMYLGTTINFMAGAIA